MSQLPDTAWPGLTAGTVNSVRDLACYRYKVPCAAGVAEESGKVQATSGCVLVEELSGLADSV